MNQDTITVETLINAPMQKIWQCWNNPEHIIHWSFASNDWEAPAAENDLRVGGKFKTRMEAKDKSAGFDFGGVYTAVKEPELIECDLGDGRHVKTTFTQTSEGVKIVVVFDPENENPKEMQKNGWQAILNNFKKYVESI